MKPETIEHEIRELEERLWAEHGGDRGREPTVAQPSRWRVGAIAIGVASAFALVLALLPVRGSVAPAPQIDMRFRFAIALAHLPVVAAFLWIRFTRFDRYGAAGDGDSVPRSPVAREAWRQLVGGMTLLCASWFALYAWMAVVWSGTSALGAWVHGAKGLAVADILNTVGSFAFFYLYLVLDKPSVPSVTHPTRHRDFRRSLLAVGLVCALAGLASMLGRLGYFGLAELGPTSGSFVAAIAMMYFFGQLDYRYMKIPRSMIAPLYLYVAIQVAWTEIAATGNAGWYPNTLLVTALAMKVYLFSFLAVWTRRRTLQRYLDFAAL